VCLPRIDLAKEPDLFHDGAIGEDHDLCAQGLGELVEDSLLIEGGLVFKVPAGGETRGGGGRRGARSGAKERRTLRKWRAGGRVV
jgi:hypothetical protein